MGEPQIDQTHGNVLKKRKKREKHGKTPPAKLISLLAVKNAEL